MLFFALCVSAFLLLVLWNLFSGAVYRRPLYFVALGFMTCTVGVACAYFVDASRLFQDAVLAGQMISFTVAATGGGIIANGLQLRAQRLASQDLADAEAKRHDQASAIDQLLKMFDEMKNEASPAASDDEVAKIVADMSKLAIKLKGRYAQSVASRRSLVERAD